MYDEEYIEELEGTKQDPEKAFQEMINKKDLSSEELKNILL